MNYISVPEIFRPHIIPVYPPNNNLIFEEWFAKNYVGCNTDRYYLPIFPTSYWVNHDYGNNQQARKDIQEFVDMLPSDKKYFSLCQYDDGFMLDWKDKDVLEFNMSKKIGVELPLLCQPHPYSFSGEKKYLVNFVGSRTHPIRNELERFKGREGWHISYEPHNIEDYCRIMSESFFTICPRGYGLNSFRCCEGLQYNSIPIYLSDIHIEPFGINFNEYGIRVKNADEIDNFLSDPDWVYIADKSIISKEYYKKYYTYEGCFNQIIKSLEAEYNSRQTETKIAYAFGRIETTKD